MDCADFIFLIRKQSVLSDKSNKIRDADKKV